MHKKRLLRRLVFGALVAAAALLPGSSLAGHTTSAPYITLDTAGTVEALIESGDVHDGVEFQGIPDGIGLRPTDDDDDDDGDDDGDGDDGDDDGRTVEIYVTHEESRVPFRSEADLQDASITRWTVDVQTRAIVDASVVLPHTAGFIRFCSAFMAGPDEDFSTYTFFANEESNDILDVPAGAPYGPDPALAPKRQAGYAVAVDTDTGAYTQIAGMGRHNHENTVVVPGDWDSYFALSTDDTFNAPSSQLYGYLFEDEEDLWEDGGSLWAFRVTRTNGGPVDPTDPFNGANDYGDITTGDDWQGEFIRVPKAIARGQTGVAPQDALENWSNANNIFQFIRLEDLAYDRKNPRVVYLADTGEARAIADATTGRLRRGASGTQGPYPNGRIFRMELDDDNPRMVTSFSILLDADAGGYDNPNVMHQPDNMDTSKRSLMVQEDTGQAPNSRIWRYDFASTTWSVVAHVNDPDWESSGIVDASDYFGPGAWILDVQAHGDFVQQQTVGGVKFKQEDGQLLLMTIPGT